MSDDTNAVTAVWARPQITVVLSDNLVSITVIEVKDNLRLNVESISFDAIFAAAVIKAIREATKQPAGEKPGWEAPL